MTLERITALTAPPVIGQFYMVPTVLYLWNRDRPRPWPVFLNLHADPEHFNFEWEHYHVDPRFLTKREWRDIAGDDAPGWHHYTGWQTCNGTPLSWGVREKLPFPAVVWRRRQCQRATDWQFPDHKGVQSLKRAYAGTQCDRARTGWVCPHRNYPLGTIEPVDGVVTCPLHGLRIDTKHGVVLPAETWTS